MLPVETAIPKNSGGLDAAGVRVPFGDYALRETHFHGNGFLSRRIEVEHRRFHAHGAAQAQLEAGVAKVLDKGRQIGRAGQREPLHGLPIGAGDGCERTPFVDREAGVHRARMPSGHGDGDDDAGGQ